MQVFEFITYISAKYATCSQANPDSLANNSQTSYFRQLIHVIKPMKSMKLIYNKLINRVYLKLPTLPKVCSLPLLGLVYV